VQLRSGLTEALQSGTLEHRSASRCRSRDEVRRVRRRVTVTPLFTSLLAKIFKKNTNYFYAVRINISSAILCEIFIQIGLVFLRIMQENNSGCFFLNMVYLCDEVYMQLKCNCIKFSYFSNLSFVYPNLN